MRVPRAAIAVAASISSLCPAALTRAQPAAESGQAQPDFEAAKRHYGAAEAAAAAGDWATAIAEYDAAYQITRDPVLFFKLGEAHEKAGQCTEAVGFYRRYLGEGKPSEQFRADTEARIAACQARAEAAEPSAAPTEPAPPQPDAEPAAPAPAPAPAPAAEPAPPAPGAAPPTLLSEEPSWQETAAWASVGVAVAAATAGAVFGLSSSSREEDIENLLSYRDPSGQPTPYEGSTRERYQDLIDEGERFETLAWVSFGVTAAAVGTAAVFFVLEDRRADDELGGVAITPAVSRGGAGLSAGWRF